MPSSVVEHVAQDVEFYLDDFEIVSPVGVDARQRVFDLGFGDVAGDYASFAVVASAAVVDDGPGVVPSDEGAVEFVDEPFGFPAGFSDCEDYRPAQAHGFRVRPRFWEREWNLEGAV